MVIKLVPKKSESKVQDKTVVYKVNFQAKLLVSKTVIDNTELSTLPKDLTDSPECCARHLTDPVASGE